MRTQPRTRWVIIAQIEGARAPRRRLPALLVECWADFFEKIIFELKPE